MAISRCLAFLFATSIILSPAFLIQEAANAQLLPVPGILEGEKIRHINNILKEISTTPLGKAGDLVPALLESLSGLENRAMYEVYQQMRSLLADPSVVFGLIKALKTDKCAIASSLLANSKSHGADFDLTESEIKDVLVALGSEDPEVRKNLAQLLGSQVPAQDCGIHAALIRLMTSDPQSHVRLQAAQSLGRVGREAYFKNTAPIAEAYATVLRQDPSPQVRSAAASGLSQMGSKAAPAASVLPAALQDNSASVRSQVLQTVIHLGPLASNCLDELIDMYNGPSDNYYSNNKDSVLQAFAALGPESAAKTVPLIIPLIKARTGSRAPSTGASAARALASLGPESVKAVPALIKMLDSPFYSDRDAAARALGAMGPQAKEAVAALKKAASDDRHAEGEQRSHAGSAKQAAREALFRISGENDIQSLLQGG